MSCSRISKIVLLTLIVFSAATASGEEPGAASGALDRLKALEGSWHSVPEGEGAEGQTTRHEFRNSAGGTVVMETMHADDPAHEMINMYHLDGDDLVLTHYCAGDNQPTMKLARPLSSPNELRFDFTGGTNLDPATDEHIHAARLRLVDADTLETSWTGYKDGKEAGVMTWTLKRGK